MFDQYFQEPFPFSKQDILKDVNQKRYHYPCPFVPRILNRHLPAKCFEIFLCSNLCVRCFNQTGVLKKTPMHLNRVSHGGPHLVKPRSIDLSQCHMLIGELKQVPGRQVLSLPNEQTIVKSFIRVDTPTHRIRDSAAKKASYSGFSDLNIFLDGQYVHDISEKRELVVLGGRNRQKVRRLWGTSGSRVPGQPRRYRCIVSLFLLDLGSTIR